MVSFIGCGLEDCQTSDARAVSDSSGIWFGIDAFGGLVRGRAIDSSN